LNLDTYFFLEDYAREHEFPRGKVFHLREPDLHQEVYGLPQYLGALQSAFLNEAATLFRRRYYANGSHAGFILYVTDPAQNQEDIDAMRSQLVKTKGSATSRISSTTPNGKGGRHQADTHQRGGGQRRLPEHQEFQPRRHSGRPSVPPSSWA
jgi:capsid portal protein